MVHGTSSSTKVLKVGEVTQEGIWNIGCCFFVFPCDLLQRIKAIPIPYSKSSLDTISWAYSTSFWWEKCLQLSKRRNKCGRRVHWVVDLESGYASKNPVFSYGSAIFLVYQLKNYFCKRHCRRHLVWSVWERGWEHYSCSSGLWNCKKILAGYR